MTEYNMYDAKTHLSEIVKNIENKTIDSIVLSRNGKPVAKIIPYEKEESFKFGIAKGKIDFPKDVDLIFDEIDISSDFEGEI